MRPTFFGIEIARTGLTVSQKGLDVTGHNVANVDTAGYTRQRLVNTAIDPYNCTVRFKPVESALVGQGARIMILDQIRQGHLDRIYRNEANSLADWSTRTQGLTYVEALFEGTDDTDLTELLAGLYDGFNAFQKEGNDIAQRENVISEATKLVDQLKYVYGRLVEQQADQERSVVGCVDTINNLLDQLVELNHSIYRFERGEGSQPANDLRDKRNLLLDELSSYVDITYEETDDRHFHVYIGSTEVVNHRTVQHMEVKTETKAIDPTTDDGSTPAIEGDSYTCSTPGFYDSLGNFTPLVFGTEIKGGELKAHVELRDSVDKERPGIPYFIQQLNSLARAIVQTVNEQHMQGYTRAAEGHPSINGQIFFEDYFDHSTWTYDPSDFSAISYNGITAGNIKLADQLLDPIFGAYYVAASSEQTVITSGSTEPNANDKEYGNQQNAIMLYRISDKTNTAVGKLTDFANSISFAVATTLSQSKTRTDLATSLVLSADNARTSVSGVSLDEEMTSLIRYQHAFNGASRVLTTMDEALDVVINRMGRVGL